MNYYNFLIKILFFKYIKEVALYFTEGSFTFLDFYISEAEQTWPNTHIDSSDTGMKEKHNFSHSACLSMYLY